jgi:hypothetical protein
MGEIEKSMENLWDAVESSTGKMEFLLPIKSLKCHENYHEKYGKCDGFFQMDMDHKYDI